MCAETVREWQKMYRVIGRGGLLAMGVKRARYDYETKVAAARAVVDGGMSKPEAMVRFGIVSAAMLAIHSSYRPIASRTRGRSGAGSFELFKSSRNLSPCGVGRRIGATRASRTSTNSEPSSDPSVITGSTLTSSPPRRKPRSELDSFAMCRA